MPPLDIMIEVIKDDLPPGKRSYTHIDQGVVFLDQRPCLGPAFFLTNKKEFVFGERPKHSSGSVYCVIREITKKGG